MKYHRYNHQPEKQILFPDEWEGTAIDSRATPSTRTPSKVLQS